MAETATGDPTETTPQASSSDVVTGDAQVNDKIGDGQSLIEDELLVEEISIDGMCGVY